MVLGDCLEISFEDVGLAWTCGARGLEYLAAARLIPDSHCRILVHRLKDSRLRHANHPVGYCILVTDARSVISCPPYLAAENGCRADRRMRHTDSAVIFIVKVALLPGDGGGSGGVNGDLSCIAVDLLLNIEQSFFVLSDQMIRPGAKMGTGWR